MKNDAHHSVARCDDPMADALMNDVRGDLEDEVRPRLEEHLARCPACRARRETLAWIDTQARRWGTALFGNHVPARELLSYLEHREQLSSTRSDEIEEHLQLCGECAIDLRMLSDCQQLEEPVDVQAAPSSEEELALVAPPSRGARSARRSWWDRARRQGRPKGRPGSLAGSTPAPAWAVAAVLLLLMPVAGGVGYWLRGTSPVPLGRSIPAPQRLLSSGERGQAIRTDVVLPERGPLAIEFHVPILADGSALYEATLFDASGRETWRGQDLASHDAFGSFLLLLDASRLGEGPYLLRVLERDAASGEVLQSFEFGLTLRR